MLHRCFFRQMMLLLLFLFLFPWSAFAVPTVSMSFVGNDTFLLSGTNLEGVGKIEVVVSYDASLLANPRLTPKSFFQGATVTQGDTTAGNVRLTVISGQPMKGNGPFATLAFDPVGISPGAINSLNGRVYGANGVPLPVFFAVTNPTPRLDPSDPDDAPMIKERELKGETFLGGGVSYVPPAATGGANEGREQSETAAEAGEGAGEQTSGSQVSAAPEKVPDSFSPQPQSVLERFRLFKGERTPKNLMALFDTAPAAFFSQAPPVLAADGKGSVRVTISRVAAGKPPMFTFSSARYVSHVKVSETEWLVEATPDQGMLNAGIMLLDGGTPRQIPLTVTSAARVDLITPGTVSEADFALFLKERGTPETPRYDLNGDGTRDYQDDYIFTANYLIAREKLKKNFAPGLGGSK